MNLPIQDISYLQNRIICGLLWLAFSLSVFSRFTHIVSCVSVSFLSTAREYSTAWIYHTFMACFHLLAIVNNAAMIKFLCRHIFNSLEFITRSGTCWVITFSSFYISIRNAGGSQYLPILTKKRLFFFFYYSHPSGFSLQFWSAFSMKKCQFTSFILFKIGLSFLLSS